MFKAGLSIVSETAQHHHMRNEVKMKHILFSVVALCACLSRAVPWTTERFESFLCSSRFVESDYIDEDGTDVPNRQRDAIPLFHDVMAENGWSTNDLVCALVHTVSNGLLSANWESAETKRTVAVAVRQLADINHPAVTNYFRSISGSDLHGLEKIVFPALFKYTYLEQDVMDELSVVRTRTNAYDRAASIVAWDMLDCLASMPESLRDEAKVRVAKFMYKSMRQVTSSQTWQDEELARLIPSYSNSVERLEQLRYLKLHSSRQYEREKAAAEFERLHLMPSNTLTSVPWIANP